MNEESEHLVQTNQEHIERAQKWKEAFAQAENMVAESLRDNNVPYVIYSSVAFDRQLERILDSTLVELEQEGNQVASALAARARVLISELPGDIDGVVKTPEDLRAVRRAFCARKEFVADLSIGSRGEVHENSDGFRTVYGEDETVVFAGYFLCGDKEDPSAEPIKIPVEFYCEQKIITPKLQAMSEVIDEHGLRVLTIPALREQYANTLMYEREVDASVDEKRKTLRAFCAAVDQMSEQERIHAYEQYAYVNGFSDADTAQAYISEFEAIENTINEAREGEERIAAVSRMTTFLERLKTKTAKRREKVDFLDDLTYFLDTGDDPHARK
jgi:hypothetical protein